MSAINRLARREEVELLLDWAAAEGWNPGLDDGETFYMADPQGFFVREIDGVRVAAISVVNHGPELAFLGLYLCQPGFRGRGHGRALWDHALDHAGARTIGLDGVPEQETNYAKSGFVRAGASVRHALTPSLGEAPSLEPLHDVEAAIALDAEVNGVARPAFLSTWVQPTGTRRSFTAGPGTLVTIRQCREGAKIGPLIAPDVDSAERLVRGAMATVEGTVWLDVPDANPASAQLIARLGGTETFRTARMYRGAPPPTDHSRLFGIASMELG